MLLGCCCICRCCLHSLLAFAAPPASQDLAAGVSPCNAVGRWLLRCQQRLDVATCNAFLLLHLLMVLPMFANAVHAALLLDVGAWGMAQRVCLIQTRLQTAALTVKPDILPSGTILHKLQMVS